MTPFFHGLVKAVAETFDLPGPVLEIGSFHLPRGDDDADLRSLFPAKRYRGIDIRPGPGVDCVADVEDLPVKSGSVGTVIALNTLHEVPHFWRGLDEIERILRPDGVLIVSCPFAARLQNDRSDCWRFTPRALEVLLDSYPGRILGWHGALERPAHVWAVAFRAGRPAITTSEFHHYRARLGQYAARSRARSRTLRYRLGQLLYGRRPFEEYLDHDCWETVCPTLRDDSKKPRAWRPRRLPRSQPASGAR